MNTEAEARRDYERDVAARPLYHDGTPRRPWHQLCDLARQSWLRKPRP